MKVYAVMRYQQGSYDESVEVVCVFASKKEAEAYQVEAELRWTDEWGNRSEIDEWDVI